MMVNIDTGWWFQPTPLKNDGVKVSWDDFSIPNCSWKVIKHVHHQPDCNVDGFLSV